MHRASLRCAVDGSASVLLAARIVLAPVSNSHEGQATIMGIEADNRVSRGVLDESLDIGQPDSLPPLAGLALTLPWRVAHSVGALLRPASTPVGRNRIDVGPMSWDWLQQSLADRGKHPDEA
jgi:hypothetical protein